MIWSACECVKSTASSQQIFSRNIWMRNSGVVSMTSLVCSVATYTDGRVRWFFGLARNSGGSSLPMIGTPCEVPEPRKINESDMSRVGPGGYENSLSNSEWLPIQNQRTV